MMHDLIVQETLSKEEKYEALLPQIKALIEYETNRTANLANIASALKYAFHFFWVGFYIWTDDELVLGPFQGPVACTRIKSGKGVCGTAFEKGETLLVPNVDLFPGHIACSVKTRSELVIPVFSNNNVVAVLDLDSEKLNDFDTTDKKYLEELTQFINFKCSEALPFYLLFYLSPQYLWLHVLR